MSSERNFEFMTYEMMSIFFVKTKNELKTIFFVNVVKPPSFFHFTFFTYWSLTITVMYDNFNVGVTTDPHNCAVRLTPGIIRLTPGIIRLSLVFGAAQTRTDGPFSFSTGRSLYVRSFLLLLLLLLMVQLSDSLSSWSSWMTPRNRWPLTVTPHWWHKWRRLHKVWWLHKGRWLLLLLLWHGLLRRMSRHFEIGWNIMREREN